MTQTIKQRLAISDFLKLNRKPRQPLACADSNGNVSLRSEVLCERELVGWRFVPRTGTS